MLFQYVGDGHESPQVTTPFGYRFVLHGDPIEITDDKVVAKLKGIKTFRVVEPVKVVDSATSKEKDKDK